MALQQLQQVKQQTWHQFWGTARTVAGVINLDRRTNDNHYFAKNKIGMKHAQHTRWRLRQQRFQNATEASSTSNSRGGGASAGGACGGGILEQRQQRDVRVRQDNRG